MTTEKQAERALRYIDEMGDPKNMSKEQWVEFLDLIGDGLNARAEAARAELRAELEEQS